VLSDRPILLDELDREAYVPRRIERDLLRATQRSSGVLLVGEEGSGKTTLLNWLMAGLREKRRPVARVDAAVARDAADVLDLIRFALHASHREWREGESPPEPGAVESVRLQLAAERLAGAPPATILLDNLFDHGAAHTVFGRLRDVLWQSHHRWVVTARPQDVRAFLAPPADAFFQERLTIPVLGDDEIAEFAERAGAAKAFRARSPRTPRDAVRAARALASPDVGGDAFVDAAERVGPAAASVFQQMESLGRPVTASDPDFTARTGMSPITLRRHLRALIDAGLVAAEQERSGQIGRPRMVYHLLTTSPPQSNA
jgi:DNA-binding transcriptional ArsR family regulator